jgi:hypothetical protein
VMCTSIRVFGSNVPYDCEMRAREGGGGHWESSTHSGPLALSPLHRRNDSSRAIMDIPPYTSSGALTREHYGLVRKVELASAVNIADGYILAEADVLRRRLTASGLGLSTVRVFRLEGTMFLMKRRNNARRL